MEENKNPPLESELAEALADVVMEEDNDDKHETFIKRFDTPDEIVQYWEHQLEKDILTSYHFRELWRMMVPKFLSPIPSMELLNPSSHIDDAKVNDDLLVPLERFICANADPDTVFKSLAGENEPSSICGKMFKMGDATYSCRDCAHDPTCVLCVDCFKHSEHRHHRYKISTSIYGGGYCDCGDPEAWSSHVHCSIHKNGEATSGMDTNDLINKLPETIKNRAKHVFAAVLDYIFDTMTTVNMLTLPPDLTYKVPHDHDQELGDFTLGSNDDYVTVIYNDEFHRFDDVIETIPRSIDCERQVAIGLTTLIDRIGRVVVKCSGFQVCEDVRKTAERTSSRRGGRPLKVVIMHSHVVAHQNFSQKLITWLHSIMDHSNSFRALLGSLLLENPIGHKISRLDNFLRNDIILWKAARTSIHHFLISAMLLGNDAIRRKFASIFTKNYGHMMKEFITDDHEHQFSVTSISVQLFTVPTLAHYLIAYHDVLACLFRTFMSECERKRNDRGKLEFQRSMNNSNFSRAMYILNDIKYLLTACPTDEACKSGWNDQMRKGFLHGMSNLLEIFSWMQGMDLQLRQASVHLDHEFEWEPCFRLHISFIAVIALVTKWCATDRVVYIKTIRMIFKKLFEDNKNFGEDFVEHNIAGQLAKCIDYQVSSKPVALHHPLTRLLAGLSLYMSKFDLTFDANELDIMEKPPPEQMMEPSLRTTVFVAQVQAGMWRRNGHSLQDQVTAYHDPRWRKEMEDQDITMLQLAASNMNPNDFLINLVAKYQLVNWTSTDFDCREDDSVRQINILAEEFLNTLIYIIGERFIPGVGQVTVEDCVRREIIQLLCIEPMTHSSLNKSLAEDTIHRETGLEKVVETVAAFKKPIAGSSAQGRFELKSEFYQEYNVFYYRYSRENQSRSEESQRQRQKANNEPECNPPPCPPKFASQFQPTLKIMSSDVFLHILSLILDRADNLRSRCFSEDQVHKALHIIGICLLEEERDHAIAQELVSDDYLVNFTTNSEKFEMYEKLKRLVGSQRIESHKDLLNWTINTWQRVSGMVTKMEVVEEVKNEVTEKETSYVEDKETLKKRLAAERRKKVMDQMKNAQKNFMKENKQLFDDTTQKRPRLNTEEDLTSITTVETMEETVLPNVVQCIGPDRAAPNATETSEYTCILCQDDEELKIEGRTLVTAAFLQKSTVLSNRRNTTMDGMNGRVQTVFESPLPLLTSDLQVGTHTSSCGHVMHSSCWKTYFEDIQNSERNRSRLRNPQNFNALKQEFLCPLCRTLSNSVIPLIPPMHTLQSPLLNNLASSLPSNDLSIENLEITDFNVSKGNEVDSTKPIVISFKHWLDAIFIALKYKKELKCDKSRMTSGDSSSSSAPEESSASKSLPSELVASIDVENVRMDIQRILHTATEGASRLARAFSVSNSGSSKSSKNVSCSPMKRFYTCPLDQVLQELVPDVSTSFARLFSDQEGQELAFPDSLHDIVQMFCKSVIRVSRDQELSDDQQNDGLSILEVWNSTAFSIEAAVHAEMDKGRSSLLNPSGMSSRHRDCVQALVRFCSIMSSNFGESKVVRSHALRLLSLLTEIDGLENPSILDIDAFGLLVGLTYSVPSLFNGDHAAPLPSGNVQDQHLLRLIYLVHLVQIMITTDQFSRGDHQASGSSQEGDNIVLEVLHEVRDAVGFASDNDGSECLTGQAVWNDLKEASVPFLRLAAVFYYNLTGVQGPAQLQHFAPNEHEELCKYLGLPSSPQDLFQDMLERGFPRLWAGHPAVTATLAVASSEVRTLTFPLKLNSLIQLPDDYTELINNVSTFSCPNFMSDESRVPAMCLICGQVMCSQSYCCQTTIDGHQSPVGACTAHTLICGGGVGIFLRVRECKVVLLAGSTKGCFVPPPYVDQYGETDVGLRRGNPLKLDREKYRNLYKIWLNHGIPQKISHSLEANHYMINTPWFQL